MVPGQSADGQANSDDRRGARSMETLNGRSKNYEDAQPRIWELRMKKEELRKSEATKRLKEESRRKK